MTARELWDAFLSSGREFIVRGNRLQLWPPAAYRHLTDAERALIKQHRDELKVLVQFEHRETTVEWKPPAESKSEPPQPVCEYCRAACVGQDDPRFETLHYRDPLQTERRVKRQREIALQNMRPL